MGGGDTSSTVNLDPRLQSFVDSILGYAPQVMERPFPNYTLPRIAGFTPDQLQGFQMVRDNVGSHQPAMNQAMQTATQFAQRPQVVGKTFPGAQGVMPQGGMAQGGGMPQGGMQRPQIMPQQGGQGMMRPQIMPGSQPNLFGGM